MDNLNFRGVTMNMVSAAFVLGTTSTYTTTVTTECVIDGVFATTLGAQTNTASPTTDAKTGAAFVAMADNQACALVWGITLAGAIALCQGKIVDTQVGVTTTAGAFREAPPWPDLPDDFCPIAYNLVRTAPSASAFTPGTSSWTATGITASVAKNISVLPKRPRIV